MRFIKTIATAWAGLLAACGAPGPVAPTAIPGGVASSGSQQASVFGTPGASGSMLPVQARTWTEYKLRAAQRIHAANAGETFAGPLPDPLQSIPVLEVQLNRDGSVRNIRVLRTPKQSPETLEMAMRAIRRAAPFGPVSHLPQPWQFSETFLYNENLKFQVRTLAEAP